MNCDRWRDLIPAYALGALDEDARPGVESHLNDCPDCRAELDEYRAVVERLDADAPILAPPEDLRGRVLAEALATDASSRPDIGAAPTEGPSERPWTPWVVAIAASIVAIWAGASYRGAVEREAELALQLDQARATIEVLQIDQADREAMLAALAGTDVRTATLVSTPGEPRVRLFLNGATNQLLVTAFDLPAASAGRTYQLWGLAPGRPPESLGTFDVDASGRGFALRPLTAPADYEQSAVSDEPIGGSPQPTTQPFLIGVWSPAGP